MSHEITIRADGFAEAAFALQPAWHGLGTVLDHAMSSGEALSAAGLDWLVVQESLYRQLPVPAGEVIADYEELEGYKLNVRQDTGLVLGTVSDDYKVVQNHEAFAFLDALVEDKQILFESAFSLYGGKRVCLLARMPGYSEVVRGDPILPYILMSLGHDGSSAIRFGAVATRVVCANTYAVANQERGVRDLVIQHTGRIEDKLERARAILGLAKDRLDGYGEVATLLAQRRLTQQEWQEYLDLMCPTLDPRDPDYTDRRAEAIADTRLAIRECFTNERQSIVGIERSAWAAYNAVAEHIDHLPRRGATRERKAEARFNVCLYGAGRDMKERAFQAACRFAGVELAS